jgi:iron complex transport system substrate-binding protein
VKHLRFLSSALVALVLLSACGSQAAAPVAQPTAAPVEPIAAPVEPTSAPAEPTTAPEVTEAPVEASTRTIVHAMGETEVPANPVRVVTLDMGELDAALLVGIKPVGSVTALSDGVFPSYMGDATEGIELVGTIQEPNLEKIAALKPDLILSNKLRNEAIYEHLSAIAPTVYSERLGDAWLDNFKLYTDALGKKAEGEQLVAEYEQRLANLSSMLGEGTSMPSVSMIRFMQGGQVRMYHVGSYIGTILQAGGFPRPESQQLTDQVWTEVNKEILDTVDADIIFYGVYGNPEESLEAEYLQDPLWQQLSAVKNEKVFQINDDYWYTGIGLMAAHLVIDDLESFLAPAQ